MVTIRYTFALRSTPSHAAERVYTDAEMWRYVLRSAIARVLLMLVAIHLAFVWFRLADWTTYVQLLGE